MSERLRVAARVSATAVEGPFVRYAVWVQGCSLACPGCCNPEMWAADAGTELCVDELVGEVQAARKAHQIEGVTLLGGEPCQQLAPVISFVQTMKSFGLGVIVFTGYRHSEVAALCGGHELLAAVDTLVDGRFVRAQPEPDGARRFVGSRNQTLVHLTPRYADPSLWRGPPQVEIQVSPTGSLSLHGAPELTRRVLAQLRRR